MLTLEDFSSYCLQILRFYVRIMCKGVRIVDCRVQESTNAMYLMFVIARDGVN